MTRLNRLVKSFVMGPVVLLAGFAAFGAIGFGCVKVIMYSPTLFFVLLASLVFGVAWTAAYNDTK